MAIIISLSQIPPHPHRRSKCVGEQLALIGKQTIGQSEMAIERDFAEEGGGDLVERGFVDGAPGLVDLGFTAVGFGVSAVVLAVGQHQFVGQAVEGAAGDAEVMGFYSVVFDAEDGGRGGAFSGPGGVVGSFRGNERVADGAAVVGPA